MKLEDTGQTSMDLNFEIPEAGVSILQFLEGISKRTNEKSGKTTLQLPMVIDKVLEGPEDNEGKKLSHFVPIETAFGEKQLAGILTMTGLIGQFAQKFGSNADISDDSFINALKLKLPGKMIKCTHEVRKDNAGKDRVNIVRFEKVATNGTKAQEPRAKTAKAGADKGASAADDEW